MEKNNERCSLKFLQQVIVCFCLFSIFISCTKYTGNTRAASTSGSTTGGGSSSATPLPGSGSGSGSSGSSGSGGSGSAANPHAYIQSLNFSTSAFAYVTYNDSIALKKDGSYTVVYAGNGVVKSKIGNGLASDPVQTTASYLFKPYSYYTYVLFTSPAAPIGEVLLTNDLTPISGGAAQVRFLSIDPLTTSTPVTFKLSNYLDNVTITNRKYLDNKTDSNFNKFQSITPGISVIKFLYLDSTVLTFNQNFESGKKYTVFSGALSYVASSKGTLPVSFYQVAQHN
ncbi:MAG: hypothetical protein KGZ59_08540 [Chitinophagaceae bacterium]|nr:hypothetical protein [Chitinophagaceae bacterium]